MDTLNLFQLQRIIPPEKSKKILTVVLDGIGLTNLNTNFSLELSQRKNTLPAEAFVAGNAVNAAYTPNLSRLIHHSLFRTLRAHGTAVGLPSDDDMGNSEVGHNTLGAGRVFDQGAKLVNEAFRTGALFKSDVWKTLIDRDPLRSGQNTLHLCGLLSDGNVHSHQNHLFALIQGAQKAGVRKVRLHLLLDGRDVPPFSALEYVTQLESFLQQVNSEEHFQCLVASGGGRSCVTMDRYQSNWAVVERGYCAHVLGEGRFFPSLRSAVETLREEQGCYDQDLPAFVIAQNEQPLGPVLNGDSFIFFNFRGDRALQISRALTEKNFSHFERKRFPEILYAGLTQYDGDLKLPKLFLVAPPFIKNTIGELLSRAEVKQFACSETQKYGHVTYFWNGNRSGKFSEKDEHYVEILSHQTAFHEEPWMKSAEIANETIKQMFSNSFEIGRINFANGDMVGHSGDFPATVLAVAAVDLALGRLMKAAQETNTILLVTADHGNADEMFERDKKTHKILCDEQGLPKIKTSHTLAPVPFVLFNTEILEREVSLKQTLPQAGLANVAATLLELAGFEAPPFYEPSLIVWGEKKNKLLSTALS